MDYLNKLMYWRGIGESYFNYRGENITVAWDNRLALLTAMGLDLDDEEALQKQAYQLDIEPWQHWLRPLILSYVENSLVSLPLNVKPEELEQVFRYTFYKESNETVSGQFCPNDFEELGDYLDQGVRYSCRNILLPFESIGYHQIELTSGELSQRSEFVVAPKRAYLPPVSKTAGKARPWGIVLQLYTLRSENNWGIGDFSDLQSLIEYAAERGANAIGLNPLHALKDPVKDNFSPYSPSDRRFLCPLYIDPETEPEFSLLSADLELQKSHLRQFDNVNYEKVYELKYAVFDQMFRLFCVHGKASDKDDFQVFKTSQGRALKEFALFQHLDELGKSELLKDTELFEELALTYSVELDFHCYLQWLAYKQLTQCQKLCDDKGMSIGLIRDLAVGANGSGSEVQLSKGLFCTQSSVGAPPDPLAEQGQNWGLPPMDPAVLKQTKFSHFIQLLRDNMSACGALRIDHAMSLLRLWWCPPGKTADYGAYVYYPFHELLGLLKLESARNKCVVVGEDMGVVPPELRQALVAGGILTNKLFYFEKNHDASFKAPEYYDEQSMAMLTNHDVPTLASWWDGTDLHLRDSLNQLEDGITLEQVLQQRNLEKHSLLNLLVEQRLLTADKCKALQSGSMNRELMQKIIVCASRCRSRLFVLQLEDLELMDAPVNVPGTSTEYDNWQRKISRNLSDIFSDSFVIDCLEKISVQRH